MTTKPRRAGLKTFVEPVAANFSHMENLTTRHDNDLIRHTRELERLNGRINRLTLQVVFLIVVLGCYFLLQTLL